jgi:GT2 family glycosyltransferase
VTATPGRAGEPTLSVVIAAFDAQPTLPDQLAALARQDADVPWEVVVADNGSADGTRDMVARLAATTPRLRLVDASARRGPAAARNAGARASTAPLLAFCDADDVVADDWVAAMAAALDRAEVVVGRSRRPEYNSRPDEPEYFTWGLYRVPFFPYLEAGNAGNLAVRREAFDEVGGFDERLRTGEDLDLCWRLQLAGHRIAEEPAAVVTFRNRPTLRATVVQTYAYGAGNRALVHKYARVAAAFAAGPLPDEGDDRDEPDDAPAADGPVRQPGVPVSPSPGLVGRAWRKVTRLRRPSDLTTVTRSVATWAGFRFGRLDPSIGQLEPPARLPSRWSS